MDEKDIGGMPFGQVVVPENEMTPAALRVFYRRYDDCLPSTIVFTTDIVAYDTPKKERSRHEINPITITPSSLKASNVRKLLDTVLFGNHDRPVKCGRL